MLLGHGRFEFYRVFCETFDLRFLSYNLALIKQYRYSKVSTNQVGPGGRLLLTLRYPKPDLVGNGRSEFYRAFLVTFDLQFLSHILASIKQYRYSKVNTHQVGPGGHPLLTLR